MQRLLLDRRMPPKPTETTHCLVQCIDEICRGGGGGEHGLKSFQFTVGRKNLQCRRFFGGIGGGEGSKGGHGGVYIVSRLQNVGVQVSGWELLRTDHKEVSRRKLDLYYILLREK